MRGFAIGNAMDASGVLDAVHAIQRIMRPHREQE